MVTHASAIMRERSLDRTLIETSEKNPLSRSQAAWFTATEGMETIRSAFIAIADTMDIRTFTSSDYRSLLSKSWEMVSHRASICLSVALAVIFPSIGSKSLNNYINKNQQAFEESGGLTKEQVAQLQKENGQLKKDNQDVKAENQRLNDQLNPSVIADEVEAAEVAEPIILEDDKKQAMKDKIDQGPQEYTGGHHRVLFNFFKPASYQEMTKEGYVKVNPAYVSHLQEQLKAKLDQKDLTDQEFEALLPSAIQDTFVNSEGTELPAMVHHNTSTADLEGWSQDENGKTLKISALAFTTWAEGLKPANIRLAPVVEEVATDLGDE